MQKLYTTKLINRPEMKFYLGGSLGLVISLKTRSLSSYLIKRESLMFSLKQYCLDFPTFTMIDSKFHLSPTFTCNLSFEPETKIIYV